METCLVFVTISVTLIQLARRKTRQQYQREGSFWPRDNEIDRISVSIESPRFLITKRTPETYIITFEVYSSEYETNTLIVEYRRLTSCNLAKGSYLLLTCPLLHRRATWSHCSMKCMLPSSWMSLFSRMKVTWSGMICRRTYWAVMDWRYGVPHNTTHMNTEMHSHSKYKHTVTYCKDKRQDIVKFSAWG